MRKLLIPLFLSAFVLTGCEAVPHYNRTKVLTLTEPRPKKPYGSAKLYEKKEDVKEPYEVLAILSVDGNAGEEAMFFKAFLYRTADLGGDAVIIYRVSQSGNEAVYRGEVIRMK